MTIASLDITNSRMLGPLQSGGGERLAEVFAGRLREAGGGDKAREAAEKLVASALVAPLLGELRDQPLDTKLFHGGFAEDAFRGQMDTLLADEIVKSSRFPIVDRIYRDITRQAAAKPSPEVDLHG